MKGKRDFRNIVLVEVIWNRVMGILDCRLMEAIQFYDTLHGLLTGRGTGTVSLKSNLLQKMAYMREEFLYEIFLDLHKAYDSLDLVLCLNIFATYGVVPLELHIHTRYWDRISMVAQAGGYFMSPSKGQHGVTQGDPLYPTIFTMVVDAVLRHWVSVC